MTIQKDDKPAPPTFEKLLKMLEICGAEMVQEAIKQFSLPYLIEDGKLRSVYTQGELYLQKFITQDRRMLELKQDVIKISPTPYEVLITGDSGVGKELIAKSMIDKREGRICSVNCAGFPRDLIESELFGHTQGAFTGASRNKEGLLSSAKDGVMFLDEVGELPLDVQAKLLRAIQDKVIRQVGSVEEKPINCKFVCATHRDIKKMVKENLFRQDLYARISTLELHISNLEERIEDALLITQSLEGGDEFLLKHKEALLNKELDLSLNVRSLQQYVIRYKILGKI
jgi:two-component system NtrC family response regulator